MTTITYGTVATARMTAQPTYGRTATGYGAKIPTRYMVTLTGETRERRVYAMVYGNAGSLYVIRDGGEVFIDDLEIVVALSR